LRPDCNQRRVIGPIAQEAGVDTLLPSHFMARSRRNLDDNIAIIKRHFDAHVVLANDLDCIITASILRKTQWY